MTRTLIFSALFFPLIAFGAQESRPPAWAAKMQKLSQTLSEVMPELVSEKTPDKKALKKLQAGAQAIQGLAHDIKQGAKGDKKTSPPDSDPSLVIMAAMFEREAKNAQRALQNGNIEYGKSSLRLVTSYCISCHTRTSEGPQFPTLPLNPSTERLSRMQKAQLLAATRQFDAALTEFEDLISDPAIAGKKQIIWGRAVRQALTIAIRVQKSPDRALKVIQRVENLPTIPVLFKEFVQAWKKSITDWKAEGKKTFDSEEALFEEGKRLSKLAEGIQKYPMDHSADVLYLRVSLNAHEILSQYPEGKHVPDELLALGNAYALLDDYLLSPLPEMYYETCIRRAPQTPIAKQCYQRYEANVYFGYSGSAGTSIPDDIAEVMKELKKLAGHT